MANTAICESERLIENERESLRVELAEWLDPLLTCLGLLTLIAFLVQVTGSLSAREAAWLNDMQIAIWAIFAVEFAAELLLACNRLAYLRQNWFMGIAVLLPALRVVRALGVLIALRHMNFLWLLVRTNRSIQALRRMVPGRETAYLVLLTSLVVGIGTAGIYYFEQGQTNAQVHTLGDALWWAACLVTTINNGTDPVSPEGRILAILMRIYAVGVFGLVAGNVASFLVQSRQEQAAGEG